MKAKKTWLDRAVDEFDRLPEQAKPVIILFGLLLIGMIASNHTTMIDLINLILVVKGLSGSGK